MRNKKKRTKGRASEEADSLSKPLRVMLKFVTVSRGTTSGVRAGVALRVTRYSLKEGLWSIARPPTYTT